MIGPGEPNALNSGLGIAADQIAKYLATRTELTLIQPYNGDQDCPDSGVSIRVKNADLSKFDELNLMSELTKVNVRAGITPYFYPYLEVQNEEEYTLEEETQAVKNELENFTSQVLAASQGIEFDVIYAHDWTAIPAGMDLKEKTKKPLVVHMHSLDHDRNSQLNQSWIHGIEQASFKESDAIISVSDYTADVITHNYGEVKTSKVHTVYNGNEALTIPKVKKVFKEKLILFVGRLTGQKGPNVFLDIAEKVLKKYPNVRFVLAGQGHLMSGLILAVASKKMGSKFHFTGHIDREKLAELYSIADVYCMPSVSEPFGLAALEAAQAGIPVVLSRQSGAAEVLPGALCSDHWDVDGFAHHILAILKNKKTQKKVVESNKVALKELTWDNTAKKILEVFNNIK